MMNFSRDVARQNSCYTYVIEDDDPGLANRNIFEVRGKNLLKKICMSVKNVFKNLLISATSIHNMRRFM